MSITVLVFTDGRRQCISRTLPEFHEAWSRGPGAIKIDRKIIINDAADKEYAEFLDRTFPDWECVHHEERRGFGGAIQSGWDQVETDWVFHLEDDFLFGTGVRSPGINPAELIKVLQLRGPNLIQLALKRQPCNDEEARAGDLMLVHEEAWTKAKAEIDGRLVQWSEQRLFFTTNPSIYRGSLTERSWPQVPFSEGVFSHELLQDPAVRFGMLGWPGDAPRVQHIGDMRVGKGY